MYGFNIIHNKSESSFSLNGDYKIQYYSPISEKTTVFYYTYFHKFSEDKLFEEDRNYIVGIDGVILNLQKLKNAFGISNYFKLVVYLWNKEGYLFPRNLKGEFSGFVFDKNNDELHVFGNQLATKPFYYSKIGSSIVFSFSLGQIIEYKNKLKYVNCLDKKAVYSLLTFGGMIENETLLVDVKRIHAGQIVSIKGESVFVKSYQDFNEVSITIDQKKEAIELLDYTFNEALNLEYAKDVAYNYKHLGTLSGGLDSRMNILLAHQKGFKVDVFCFSQSNYYDHLISKKIAEDYGLYYQFILLDDGYYLMNLEENVKITNGTMFYLSSAHFNAALKNINLDNYGLIHTGQIGDGVLGGFVSDGKKSSYLSKTISRRLTHKLVLDNQIFYKYASEETFKLLNRVCNLTNSGSFVVESNGTYLVSPFMDTDFVTACLSINPRLKVNARIYIDWINANYKNATNYVWERTKFKPNQNWKTKLSLYTNKIWLEYKKLTNQAHKLSMTPLDYWYQKNSTIRNFYNQFFHQNIDRINDESLKKDLILMFENGNVIEKSLVLTVLEFIKNYKIKN